MTFATPTEVTLEAQRLVRDPSLFKWYAVALLALVFYAYANEAERGRWDIVAAGLAVWFADWFNEIVNAVILELTDRAPLWATTGPTAYQFLVGLNVEISFMFALAGVDLREAPARRPRRADPRDAEPARRGARSVAAERRRRAVPARDRHVPLGVLVVELATFPVILVFGYLWFYLFAAWVFDAPTARTRWRRVGGLAAIDVAMALVFGVILGWL